jgi:hypothetical protein
VETLTYRSGRASGCDSPGLLNQLAIARISWGQRNIVPVLRHDRWRSRKYRLIPRHCDLACQLKDNCHIEDYNQ